MKKIISFLLSLILILSCVSVFATDMQTREIYAFKGKLFYCDTPTSRIVIREISPVVSSPNATQLARQAEYLEIKVATEGLRAKNGSAIAIESLNIYADSEIWFILSKAENGYLSIPYLTFK